MAPGGARCGPEEVSQVARWRVSIDVTRGETGDVYALREFYEKVMDNLALLDVASPSLCGEPIGGPVAFNLQVDATSLDEVVSRGIGALRAAIHASGGVTPDWPLPPAGDGGASAPRPVSVRFVGARQELAAS